MELRAKLAGEPFEQGIFGIRIQQLAEEAFAGFEILRLRLGAELGEVEQARLRLVAATDGATGRQDFALTIETQLAWQDLQANLDLDKLPDFFPLPPYSGDITAFLNWEVDTWQLRFSAAVEDVDSIWRFVPQQYRPEVSLARFVFAAAQKQNDRFTGKAALEITFRLPPLRQRKTKPTSSAV